METTSAGDIQEYRLGLIVGVMRHNHNRWLPFRRHIASDLCQKRISDAPRCGLKSSHMAWEFSPGMERESQFARQRLDKARVRV
jgi:hypothetical protein